METQFVTCRRQGLRIRYRYPRYGKTGKGVDMKCRNCDQVIRDFETECPNCGIDVHFSPPAPNREGTAKLRQQKGICSVCEETVWRSDLKEVDGQQICRPCLARRTTSGTGKHAGTGKHRRQDGSAWANPRKNERVDVDHAFVRLAKPGGLFGLFGEDANVGPAVDLSLTGVQCVTELNVKEGSEVKVELRLPGADRVLLMKGVIRWARDEQHGRRRVGVEFTDVDFEVRKAIERHMRSISMRDFHHNDKTEEGERRSVDSGRIPIPEHLQSKTKPPRHAEDDEDARGLEPTRPRPTGIMRKGEFKEPPPASAAPPSPAQSPAPPPEAIPPKTRPSGGTRHIGKRDTREDFDF